MFQSLLPSLQRAALRPSSITRALSSIPPIPSDTNYATSDQIAEAKRLIISDNNPRSRMANKLDKRNFPSIKGIPTNEKNNPRDPTETPDGYVLYPSKIRYDTGVLPADMPYLHFRGHDEKPKPKFKSPRKRASKLFNELQMESVAKSKESKPEVWEVPFKVGDAIELEVLDDGGVDNPNSKPLDVIRGVVLGRENRGLDTSIYLKDVLYGEHVERKVKLHSPMVKSLKVLEEGFVNRGKKKGRRIKRAKLYYLRDRKPEETRVTKVER